MYYSIIQAIQLLDHDTKAAYLQAVQRAPEVVEHESDPLKFVRANEYNIWTAAVKLCRYWKERKYAFGPDKFTKPLNLSGFGAMGREDMLSLQSGATVILPKTRDNKYVVFCDRRQHIPSLDRKCRLRCLFYLESTMDESAYRDGMYTVTLVVTTRNEEVDKDYINRSVLFADQISPVKNQFLFLNKPPKNNHKYYEVQEFLSDYIRTAMDKATFSFLNLDVIFEREEGDIYRELERLGLNPEGIPTSVGGKWTYVEWNRACLQQALKDREAHDRQRKKRARRKDSVDHGSDEQQEQANTIHNTHFTGDDPVQDSDAVAGDTATTNTATTKRRRVRIAATGPLSVEERKARKRAANLVHSRRKRERRKKEQEALRTEHTRLQSEHAQLQLQHSHLTELLEKAERVVANHEKSSSFRESPAKLTAEESIEEVPFPSKS